MPAGRKNHYGWRNNLPVISMEKKDIPEFKPEILAPAGDRHSFLAALAAGADAVYCGLKNFSARMEAENFSLRDLAGLTALARANGRRVLVAMNTLLKPHELPAAGRLAEQLVRTAAPDGVIVQDLGLLELLRQAGFSGEVHLSTLACLSAPSGLAASVRLGVQQVVLPRELNLDEIRQMARSCPPDLGLEVFVHGALCYAVSGRCYWSSYMGGKSGLRGRCVQPCRRLYDHEGRKGYYFSCQDLSLDVLVKTLLDMPQVRTWKIEGRKKGPHYVFHAVTAYRLLRDNPGSASIRKEAMNLLQMALGRPGSHAGFLPQRPFVPLDPSNQQGSGLLVGRIPGGCKGVFIRPSVALLPGDLLRMGSEDQAWHRIIRVPRFVPKGGRLDLAQSFPGNSGLSPQPPAGTALRLVDRREPGLRSLLKQWEQKLDGLRPEQAGGPSTFAPRMPVPIQKRRHILEMTTSRRPMRSHGRVIPGMWLDPQFLTHIPPATYRKLCWWLPPVIWPNEEHLWQEALDQVRFHGAKRFVCNAPWQAALFTGNTRKEDMEIWAGPFCNAANALALEVLRRMGFCGAIASPELDSQSMLTLPEHAPLPLGAIIKGYWPLAVSRVQADDLALEKPVVSPRGEAAWPRRYGQNVWIYPDWSVDLTLHQGRLESAGYRLFVHLSENPPSGMIQRPRTSTFNWDLRLV